MAYLLDANVFIEAKNVYYSFDVCPAFWAWIDDACRRGVVCSVERIRLEIEQGQDELSEWVADDARRIPMFRAPDQATLASVAQLSQWASNNNFKAAAVAEFLSSGDLYLIADAHAHGDTVVTRERYAPDTKRVKIPNVCQAFDIPCVPPFQMLKDENARFVLGS